jgi:cytidylate kinase
MRMTVTIARQLGCGGSYIGQQVASGLGFRCIDREIVSQTAQKYGLKEADVAIRDERVSSFWERMLGSFSLAASDTLYVPPPSLAPSDREIFDNETEVMKDIAAREDCVIVGRAAAHVLPSHAGMVNIFLYAPLSFRVRRVVESRLASNEAKARLLIERSDSMRGKFITQMTGRDWACAQNYHLCVDTSLLSLEEVAGMIVEFVQRSMAGSRSQSVEEKR